MAKRNIDKKDYPWKTNSKSNPWIISWGDEYYYGKEIKTRTPIHRAQQIHKYNLGLFVSGLVALAAAFADIWLIASNLIQGHTTGITSGITIASAIFIIAILIDIVFTINLNRYIRDKRWLFLYIPSFVLMVVFAIPQIINMFGIPIPDFDWAKYIIIVVCILYMIAEVIRMILARNELDIKQEIKRALS